MCRPSPRMDALEPVRLRLQLVSDAGLLGSESGCQGGLVCMGTSLPYSGIESILPEPAQCEQAEQAVWWRLCPRKRCLQAGSGGKGSSGWGEERELLESGAASAPGIQGSKPANTAPSEGVFLSLPLTISLSLSDMLRSYRTFTVPWSYL